MQAIRSIRSLIVPLLVGGILSARASAAVVMTIDITNLSEVVFSSTGAHAQNVDSTTRVLDGIVLVGVFSSDPGLGVPYEFDSSGLHAFGASAYTEFYDGSYAGSSLNLNIAGTTLETQEFDFNRAAFEGSGIADFSDVRFGSLQMGKTGDIYAGDWLGRSVVVGQFQIIPEQGSVLLATIGMTTAILRRDRRKLRNG